MTDDIQFLEIISETADMGRDSLNHVIDKATDTRLQNVLQKQFSGYDNAYKSAEQMIQAKGGKAKKAGTPLKAYYHMVSDFKTMTAENANSKIAEMVIQGSTMGITEMTKQLNDYHGSDQALRSFAENLIQAEQSNIEEVKLFL